MVRPLFIVYTTSGVAGSVRADLNAGESATFGACWCAECDFTVPLVRAVSFARIAGRVVAASDHWRLENLSADISLVVSDLENAADSFRVRPGRMDVVIPFEIAKISVEAVPDDGDSQLLTVFGPEPSLSRRQGPCERTPPRSELLGPAPMLATNAIYIAVLRTLCEARIRVPDGPLPTSHEIAHTLSEQGTRISSRAVDGHITYLLEKLAPGGSVPPRRSGQPWKKEALVRLAFARGLFPEWAGAMSGAASRAHTAVPAQVVTSLSR